MVKYASLLFLWVIVAFLTSCHRDFGNHYSNAHKERIKAIMDSAKDSGSVKSLLDTFIRQGDLYGQVLAHETLGKIYRENSAFPDAIAEHQKALDLAKVLDDTLAVVQALNNIGTNYRRLGVMADASEYHFKALALVDQCQSTRKDIKKSRLVALNGIGNIYLTLQNFNEAEKMFRQSLVGEKELESDLGQAINYANIGAIFAERKEYDSAYVYYNYSLHHNQIIHSDVGVSLCYNHLGQIDEENGKLQSALENYQKSFEIMQGSGDRWHWLESCLSLARIHLAMKEYDKARTYLSQAKEVSVAIHSIEHLQAVYYLAYEWYNQKGDCRNALDNYIRSEAYKDSIDYKDNLVQNQRVNYEKEKSLREIDGARKEFEEENRRNKVIAFISVMFFVIACAAIGFLFYALRMRMKAHRALRQMEMVRTTFFTNLTHEFRTPLTVILGLVGRMQTHEVNKADEAHYLDSMKRQGKSLLDLVNQLLDMSKLMAKADQKLWRSGNVIAYIRMILESYKDYAASCQVSLNFNPEVNVLDMDFVPEYFEKILRNLLSNALKFTPQHGSITIKVKAEDKTFVMQIADNGKQIEEKDLPHIFDMFYQGGDGMAKNGTGLGLPYVRQMMESMGGKISACNLKSGGVAFTLSMPLRQEAVEKTDWQETEYVGPLQIQDPVLPEESEAEECDSRPSLLIVEDNLDVSYYISTLLKDKFKVYCAENGKVALEKAKLFMPDLIITDLMMPEMDGYEFCKAVRNSDIINHIPIIVVTAKSEEADRILSVKDGADAYLMKPFNAEELFVQIDRLLEHSRILREKYGKALRTGENKITEMTQNERDFINRLSTMVYANLGDRNLNADFLADKVCMSRTQLTRKLRSISGLTPTTFIMQLRMDKAKRLLGSTEKPIGDIAFICGFDDTSYFTRVFKQVFNMTPTQYRKMPDIQKEGTDE